MNMEFVLVKDANVKIRKLRKKMRYKSVENNYYFTGVILILLILLALFASPAHSGSTQSNVSGSNTAIEGGYTSTATTTYQSGSSSNSTTNSTTNSNVRSAPPSASSPSYNSMTQDVCAVGRLKLARILNDFGMKVAAVAILCQDERVFESMIQAGTPCPIDGKIGKEAEKLWSKYDNERPDYDIYVKRMKAREKKEKKIARDAALAEKKRIQEEAKTTKEFDKVDKEIKEKVVLPKKKPVKWESPK